MAQSCADRSEHSEWSAIVLLFQNCKIFGGKMYRSFVVHQIVILYDTLALPINALKMLFCLYLDGMLNCFCLLLTEKP